MPNAVTPQWNAPQGGTPATPQTIDYPTLFAQLSAQYGGQVPGAAPATGVFSPLDAIRKRMAVDASGIAGQGQQQEDPQVALARQMWAQRGLSVDANGNPIYAVPNGIVEVGGYAR